MDVVVECPSCGSAHLGPVPCGLSFRARLASIRLDPSATPTKSMSRWDRQAIEHDFGPDSRERMMDETHGLGAKFDTGEPFTEADDAFFLGVDLDHS